MEEKSWYENYVKELENSKYHFVEINEKNINDIKFEDVAFLSKAELGAMGEHGGLEILLKNGKFYHSNAYHRFDIYQKLMSENLQKLNNTWTFLENSWNVPKELKSYDLGFGNTLFVKQEFVEFFEKMIKKMQNNAEIYKNWKNFALKVLLGDKKTTPEICLCYDKNNNKNECFLSDTGHILIAGQIGSGKTVLINSMLSSLFGNNNQFYFDTILVDTKEIEFKEYYDTNISVKKIISKEKDVLNELDDIIKEGEKRFELFAESKVRNIEEYNAQNQYLRHKVVVIDEIVDYLFNDRIVANLKRILERCRAVGVYIIAATQRPDILKEKDLLKLFSTTIILRNSGYDSYFNFLKDKTYYFDDKRDMVIKSPVFENNVLQMKSAKYFDSEELNILHKKSIREMTEDDYKKVLELPEDKFVSEEEKQLKLKNINIDEDEFVEKNEEQTKKSVITNEEVEHILKNIANQDGIAKLINDLQMYDKISASLLQRDLRIGFGAAQKILVYLVQIKAIEQSDGTAGPRQILDKEKIIKILNI